MGYLILSPKGIFFSLQVYLEEETCLLLILFFSPLISSSSTSTRRIKNKMKKIFVLKVSSCGLENIIFHRCFSIKKRLADLSCRNNEGKFKKCYFFLLNTQDRDFKGYRGEQDMALGHLTRRLQSTLPLSVQFFNFFFT